jgi:hypothetical protein
VEVLSDYALYVLQKEDANEAQINVGTDAFEPVVEKLLDLITSVPVNDAADKAHTAGNAAHELLSIVNSSFAMDEGHTNTLHVVLLKAVLQRAQQALRFDTAYQAGSLLDSTLQETVAHAHHVAGRSEDFCREVCGLIVDSFVGLASESAQRSAIDRVFTDVYKTVVMCKPMTKAYDLDRQAVEFSEDVAYMYVKFEADVEIQEGCSVIIFVHGARSGNGPDRRSRYAKFTRKDRTSDLLLVPGNRITVE